MLPDYRDAAPTGAQALRPAAVFLIVSLTAVAASTRAQALSQFGLTGIAAGAAAFVTGVAFWLLDGSARDDFSSPGWGWPRSRSRSAPP